MALDDLIAYHRENCSRAKYGSCSTLRCLRRGGYERGHLPVNLDLATCEEWETINALNELGARRFEANTPKIFFD